jgi:exodeoxyribonuclease V
MNHDDLLGFTPTAEQAEALRQLEAFATPSSVQDVFVLTGPAGTGKTSIVKALAAHLHGRGIPFRITAPTARAAKVIAAKTGEPARTMHSLIYTPQPLDNGPGVRMEPKANLLSQFAVYIVDEASMVSDESSSSGLFITSEPLLTDFVRFVKEGNPANKIVFIGDSFQLPPVGGDFSPALDASYLRARRGLAVKSFALTEVLRQKGDSYILDIAGTLRDAIDGGRPSAGLQCPGFGNAFEAVNRYADLFDPDRLDKATLIAYTNRDVDWLNTQVRRRFGFDDRPIHAGDLVMLEATWIDEDHILYRGETGVVTGVGGAESRFAGLRFQEVEVCFPGEPVATGLAMLDALGTPHGLLDMESEKRLFHEVMKTNSTFRRSKNPADDPCLGAMRLRHAFAVTGHKAQGGEWEEVLLHPYVPADNLRWLYTAVTRARSGLYSWPGWDGGKARATRGERRFEKRF